MRVLFAHGFEGSPTGSKPTYMREALGWKVTAPKMSELGWSIASQTDVLIKHLDEGEYDLVVGSSMGIYGIRRKDVVANSCTPHCNNAWKVR